MNLHTRPSFVFSFKDGESELMVENGEYAEVVIWIDSDVEITSNRSIGTWSSLPVFHSGPTSLDWTPAGTRVEIQEHRITKIGSQFLARYDYLAIFWE